MQAHEHYRLGYEDLDHAFHTVLTDYFNKKMGGQSRKLETVMVEQFRATEFEHLAEFFALGFPFEYLEKQWLNGLTLRFAGSKPVGWATVPFRRVLFSAATGHNEAPNEERLHGLSKKMTLESITHAWNAYQSTHDSSADEQFRRLLDANMFRNTGKPASGLSKIVAFHLIFEWMWHNGQIKGKLTAAQNLMLYYSGDLPIEQLPAAVKRHVLTTDLDI